MAGLPGGPRIGRLAGGRRSRSNRGSFEQGCNDGWIGRIAKPARLHSEAFTVVDRQTKDRFREVDACDAGNRGKQRNQGRCPVRFDQ